ncbi:MAG: co-chaperone GroES [Planctomycetota bacterium]|jgi:chaperonin GroES
MIQPEGFKVIVKPEILEEKTEGGLYIPETVRETHERAGIRGEIVALGPKADINFSVSEDEARPAKVGDKVMFAKYGGFYIEYAMQEYRILNDEDIVALIE